jgi:hypothetical protein
MLRSSLSKDGLFGGHIGKWMSSSVSGATIVLAGDSCVGCSSNTGIIVINSQIIVVKSQKSLIASTAVTVRGDAAVNLIGYISDVL